MLQDIGLGRFQNHFINVQPEPKDRILLYQGDSVLTSRSEPGISLPCFGALSQSLRGCGFRYAFSIDEDRYFFGDAGNVAAAELPEGYASP